MRLTPGVTFDRYVIEALLGEGGMGEVYRATDLRLQRKVALKILRHDPNGDQETWRRAVTRMQREGHAAAALNHPNTVAIYDVGEHDGSPFIAMELIEGEPLRAYVGKELPLGTRVAMLRDVARALAEAHREGLVHRDVKPENVMVRQDGVVKVLDFGIARRAQVSFEPQSVDPDAPTVDRPASTLTGPGVLIGTPSYMAPEQVRGDDVDARTDQFAWGVLAYEFLSGRLPFRADKGTVGLIAAILSDTPPPLADVPASLNAVIQRALSKSPRDRYASMDELAEDLSAFITGEIAAPPTSRNASVVKLHATPTAGLAEAAKVDKAPWSRRALGAATVLAALAGLAAFTLHHPTPPLGATPGASAQAPSAAPTAITDLPVPRSDKPEALIAYREGMQALRDGTWEAARAAFQRARTLDSALSAAHLRYALSSAPYDLKDAREAFQKAILQRALLSDRDRGLLDALEPYVQRSPPDRREASRRLEPLSQRFPNDAELVFWRVFMAFDDLKETLPLTDACLALDPKYADCWQLKAHALDALGKTKEAFAAFDHCIENSFAAVDCLSKRTEMDRLTGRCEQLEEGARRLIALMPASGRPYHHLAVALRALGRPDEAVRTAAEQATKRLLDAGDTLLPQLIETELAVALGDFASAGRQLQRLGLEIGNPAAVDWQVDTPLYPSLYYEETGRLDEAGKAAAAFLAHREALALPDALPWMDRTLELHAIEMHAGLIPRSKFEAERASWLQRFGGAGPAERAEAWYTAYAMPARNAEDARQALSALPTLAPLPHQLPTTFASRAQMLLGKVYYLAGDMHAALPHLAAFASGCGALVYPFGYMQNTYRLGVAREALGDKKGACAAYQSVIERWGASGLSVTAKDASKRARALACAAKHTP